MANIYGRRNKRYQNSIFNKVQAYIADRADEASHEFELFCQKIGFKTQQRAQEQRKSISWSNVVTDDEFVGRDAEIQTNEQFENRPQQQQQQQQPNDSRSINSNDKNELISVVGAKQRINSTYDSQYRNLLGLTPPDEIDMLFTDTQSNESIPKSSIFYSTSKDIVKPYTPDSTKRVSFYKYKFERESSAPTISKQTPSPIKKQKSPAIKRSSSATQTPTSLHDRAIRIINSYDIDRRLSKLEEEVPIVQNRVHRLLNGQMEDADTYSIIGTPPPLPRRTSYIESPSVVPLSSNYNYNYNNNNNNNSGNNSSNDTPKTPSKPIATHKSTESPIYHHHNNNNNNNSYTPRTPGSVMRDVNISSSYQDDNHLSSSPALLNQQHTSHNKYYEDYFRLFEKTLRPTKQHKRHMREILYQMAFTKLRKTDKIKDAYGKLISNPFWEEIYSPKWRDL